MRFSPWGIVSNYSPHILQIFLISFLLIELYVSPLLYQLSYRGICGTRLSGRITGPRQIYFASLYFYKAFSTKPHIGLRSSFVASAGGSLICETHVNALVAIRAGVEPAPQPWQGCDLTDNRANHMRGSFSSYLRNPSLRVDYPPSKISLIQS